MKTKTSFLLPNKDEKENGSFRPQLTSLIDVMTILLVFLIKSFSVEGNLITPSADLVLPVSESKQVPTPVTTIELTKDAILKAKDLKTVEVSVPEWNGKVFVKTLTGAERNQWEMSIVKGRKVNLSNAMAELCVRAIVNSKGERLFADADATELGRKSAKALGRVYDVAAELNGLSPKDVEDLVKNSGSDLSAGSTSS